MPTADVLYLGDTSLSGAAGYLAGLLTHFGLRFDYVPSDTSVEAGLLSRPRKLIILSDYPARMLSKSQQVAVVSHVARGAGLLMIGGWESFHGHGGNWDQSSVAEVLPVQIAKKDDRQNFDQPAVWLKLMDHEITAKLPWDKRPPTIGGLNRVKARLHAQVLLGAQQFTSTIRGDVIEMTPRTLHPLLVIGGFGYGRTAALMTDLAPHWVGGFVDWGTRRVKAKAKGSWQIEVGDAYATFVGNLVRWTGNIAKR